VDSKQVTEFDSAQFTHADLKPIRLCGERLKQRVAGSGAITANQSDRVPDVVVQTQARQVWDRLFAAG
jgi:hypothetical protein